MDSSHLCMYWLCARLVPPCYPTDLFVDWDTLHNKLFVAPVRISRHYLCPRLLDLSFGVQDPKLDQKLDARRRHQMSGEGMERISL
jgi:hypothetical protein